MPRPDASPRRGFYFAINDFKTASTLRPIDLQFESRGTGPEKNRRSKNEYG
jgi:hypothetical protein